MLCLLLKQRELFAGIFQATGKQCLALHKFHIAQHAYAEVNVQALGHLYAAAPLLSHHYREVRVACYSEGMHLVPSHLHDAAPKLLAEWGTPPRSAWAGEAINDNVTLWHCQRDNWRQWFAQTFDGAAPGHSAAPMLRHWLGQPDTSGEHLVHACISDHLLEVFVTGPKGLLLANAFQCQTAEDFLYFTVLVYQQLGLDTHEVPLEISGEIEQDSTLYQLLYKYIRHIRGESLPQSISLASDLDNIKPYYYYNLLCMAL